MTRHGLARQLRRAFGAAVAATTMLSVGIAGVAGAAEATSVVISASGTGSPGNVNVTLTSAPSGGTFSGAQTYQWYDCTTSQSATSTPTLTNCSHVATNGTNPTYSVSQSDNHLYVTVVVTDGATTLEAASYFATTLAVSISGTANVGPQASPNSLTANPSGDTGSGYSNYQWYDCTSPTVGGLLASISTVPATCSAIGGAVSSSYLLQPADFDHYVTVVVENASGTWAAAASSTLLVTESAPTVTPSGLAVNGVSTDAGATVSASGTSDFANLYNATPTYQWYDCTSAVGSAAGTLASGCTAISGATSSSYTLAISDANLFVLVQVTETNASGSATEYSSSADGAVQVAAPSFTVAPTLGNQTATQISISSLGTWGGSPLPTSATVTWYRCTTDILTAPVTLPGTCSAISNFSASNSTPGWTLNSYPTDTGTYTYTFTSADLGSWILVGVQANNGVASTTTAFSASSTQFTGTAPTTAVVPVATASPQVGVTASVSQGTWTGVPLPTSFSYAWWDCASQPSQLGDQTGTALPSSYSTDGCVSLGLSSPSFTVPTAFGARSLATTFLVGEVSTTNGATNGAGTTSYFAVSANAVAAAQNSTSGSVSLSSNVNGVYTATPGSFNGSPAPTTFAYTWYDCTTNFVGAFSATLPTMSNCSVSATSSNSASHAVTAADVTSSSGGGLVVLVAATSIAGTTYAFSAPTALSNTLSSGSLSVTGQGSQAAPFVADATWDAVPTPSINYSWYLCSGQVPNRSSVTGTCIGSEASGPSYTPTFYNASYPYVVAVVVATNAAGASTLYSAGTLMVTQAPANVVRPSVPSSATTATPLVAAVGTWLGVPAPGFTYQWYVCTSAVLSATTGTVAPNGCSAIPGATASSYLPSGSYVNDYFLIEVTASNGVSVGGSQTVSVFSASTQTPLVSTLSVSSVTITGTATVGSTLLATPSVIAQGAYSTSYQWYACSATVISAVTVPNYCTAIPGATAQSFTLTVNQVNDYVTALVTVSANATTATGVAASTALVTTNIPGAPTALTASPGAGQATVSWNLPATGLPPTSYTVTASTGGATCTVAAPTRTCVVTGLLYGTAYSFTATASNSYGTSAASVASNVVYPTETVPSAPTTVSAVAGALSAAVTWSAASANGAPISLYTVTSSPGGYTCTSVATSCTVTGLTAGVAYTFSVMARNVVGPGPSSYQSAAVTPRPNVPNAPTTISVRRGNGQVTVSWTAGSSNGATVTGYMATATSASGSRYCQTTGATSCTVTGLTNGASYQLSVVATSAGGSSLAGYGPRVVPAGPPSAPIIVLIGRGRGVVMVYLKAPASTNGARIAYYQFLLNGQRWTVQSIKGRLFIRLLGLTGAHVIRVRAVSVGGASAASAPMRFVAIA